MKGKNSDKEVDFSYYRPINRKQAEFHKSKAKHKLLIGAYRSGKTYPAIHEAFFICFDNPGHEFLVARNTWDSLKDNIEKDMLRISEKAKAHYKWDKTKHDLYLKSGTVVRFRPLTLKREQLKGMNLCGFLIDDPDEDRFADIISFLYTRLTDPPHTKANYFTSIICANYEGRKWLWKTYIRGRKEGGDDMFAYWRMETKDNPTIGEDYIKTLESIHSKAWMDRYIYAKFDTYSGLIYEEFDPNVHIADLSFCFKDNDLLKIITIDCGITHPTVVLKIATDYKNIYVYDEWYKLNIRTFELGNYLSAQLQSDKFYKILIDPKAAAKDQTSGISPQEILKKEYGIYTTPANNAINYGIEIVKSLLTIREDGKPHLYIDKRCENTLREIELYHWKEPNFEDFEEMAYKEEPVDKDNDCMDCLRYGCVFLRKYLKSTFGRIDEDAIRKKKEQLWNERYRKLKIYREIPKFDYSLFEKLDKL